MNSVTHRKRLWLVSEAGATALAYMLRERLKSDTATTQTRGLTIDYTQAVATMRHGLKRDLASACNETEVDAIVAALVATTSASAVGSAVHLYKLSQYQGRIPVGLAPLPESDAVHRERGIPNQPIAALNPNHRIMRAAYLQDVLM